MQKLIVLLSSLVLIQIGGCCAAAPSATVMDAGSLTRFEMSHPQMGTMFHLAIYGADEADVNAAAAAAFARIDELNATLSDYDRKSELSRLSDSAGGGQWVKVSDDLWNVLRISDEYSRKCDGAFDITVGPVVQIWRWARRNRTMPSAERLKAAVDAVGYEKVEFDTASQSVRLKQAGMRLDAGGIGKGYACDEALKVLKARGYSRVMIDGGGGVLVGDAPPGKTGWRIGISSLDPQSEPPGKYVILNNAAISTSGDAWQHVELEGKRYSHIVDRRTGLGLTDHSSVSIVAPNGTLSDVLSTTVAVLGPKKGLEFADSLQGVAAFIVTKPGDEVQVFESAGVKNLTLESAKD